MIGGKNIIKWIGLITLYLLLESIAPTIINNYNITNKLLSNFILLIVEILITCFMIFLYKKDIIMSTNDLNKNGKNKLKYALKIWLFGLLIMLICNMVIGNIVNDLAQNELANRTILEKFPYYALPSMVLFGPICEEIIFRLAFKKCTANKYIYILLSGLLFGFAHVIGVSGLEILYIIPYTALGIAFAKIYEDTENILCSILMHILHNYICILIILFV